MHAGLARQLGHPAGLAGRLVGLMMNRRNRRTITAAVDALAPPEGAVVADIGFGGGLGVELLLDRVGSTGRVHAVELSSAMLSRAARRFRDEIANGRLSLHAASLTDLPLRPAALDGAITINTIYFIRDQDRAFSELARVLQGSGRAVIGLADPEWMSAMPTTPYGFRVRPVSELMDAATCARLHVDEDRRIGPDPHPYHLLVVSPAPSAAASS
jgi:SAM-dependent methyltransferase